jgi:hypothetical protein
VIQHNRGCDFFKTCERAKKAVSVLAGRGFRDFAARPQKRRYKTISRCAVLLGDRLAKGVRGISAALRYFAEMRVARDGRTPNGGALRWSPRADISQQEAQ